MDKKRYTLYAWRSDDEGGYGICFSDEFSSSLNYQPESGCNAVPSERLENSTPFMIYVIFLNMKNFTKMI